MCTQYLQNWRADYPGTPEGSARVFVNSRGNPFIHATIAKRIECIVKRAGITKHVTPHLFRHSRITPMINDGVQESVPLIVLISPFPFLIKGQERIG